MDISAMVVILTVFLSAIFGIAGLFIWDCEDRNPKILAAVIFLVLLTPGIITAYNGEGYNNARQTNN
jgi:ABC-type spermidine/putrescine transport system permease subunit II